MCITHFYTHIFWLFTSLSSVETSLSKIRTRTDRCSAPRKRFICHLSPKRKSAVFIQFSVARRHSLTLKQKNPPRADGSTRQRGNLLPNCSLGSRLKVACRARRHARYFHRSTWQPQHLISLLGHCDKRLDAGAVAGNPSGGRGDWSEGPPPPLAATPHILHILLSALVNLLPGLTVQEKCRRGLSAC